MAVLWVLGLWLVACARPPRPGSLPPVADAPDGRAAHGDTEPASDLGPPPECRVDSDCGDVGPCQVARCQDGRCGVVPAQGPCDDLDPCTASDRCEAGQCAGEPYGCEACARCDGHGLCLPEPGWCVIDQVCYAAGDAAGPCRICAPSSAQTVWSSRPDGTACNDQDACTTGDYCWDGLCRAGAARSCDDQNPCTDDACDPSGGCVHTTPTRPCNDHDACTAGDTCLDGACVGSPITCASDSPCVSATCDPALGCQLTSVDAPCTDNDACTAGDICVGGSCQPGSAIDCNDSDPCTLDLCSPTAGCQHQPLCCGTLGVACPAGFECSAQGACVSNTEVFVPAGPFWMGRKSLYGIVYSWDQLPYHMVTLSSYAIDRLEVTELDYQVCVGVGSCTPNVITHSPPDTHPVDGVSWAQAQAYCAWQGKRLPTEAEWEKAARGGCETVPGDCAANSRVYPWGDMLPTCELANFSSAQYPAWGCNTKDSALVGSFPAGASPYGALDMAGNVLEWVADWYAADYYCHGDSSVCPAYYLDASWNNPCGELCLPPSSTVAPEAQDEPAGPPSGVHRGVRGGSADSRSDWVQASWRAGMAPDAVPLSPGLRFFVGFRCARSLDDP